MEDRFMNKIVVTMDDIKRYKVITEVIEKRLTLRDASELLFLSYRHAIRIKQKVKDSGLEGILRKIPASAPNRQTTKQVVDKILKHREELYYDFNIMLFKDKLEEVNNMHIIRRFIGIKGIFMSLYVDKASHFTTTRIEGIHYSVSQEQEDTQIERALEELGITLIPANSPQAKGRIEVTFRLFQDRLIKEMRLAGVKSYDEANHFLIEKFLPWYNPRYTHEAESAYMPVPKGKDLDLIFCIKKQRTVNKDNTISFNEQVIQIPPADIRRSFAKTKVDVCLLEDNRAFVLYENKIIAQTVLSEDNKAIVREKKIEELLNRRQYIPFKKPSVKRIFPKTVYIPHTNHPWRRALAKGVKLKQIRQNKM